MPTLQTEYITILGAFARLFSKRIWEHAQDSVDGCDSFSSRTNGDRCVASDGLELAKSIFRIIIGFSIVRYGRVWKPVIFCWVY